jgi:hypothetical protein
MNERETGEEGHTVHVHPVLSEGPVNFNLMLVPLSGDAMLGFISRFFFSFCFFFTFLFPSFLSK